MVVEIDVVEIVEYDVICSGLVVLEDVGLVGYVRC